MWGATKSTSGQVASERFPGDNRQGQVFRCPSCPLLSTRKEQLGTGARPRAILQALEGGAQQAGPRPRAAMVQDRETKHPKHLLCFPNTGGLFRHHPDQTRSQNSECGRLGEGAAPRTGGGTCSPRQQGSWPASECLRPGTDQASSPVSRGKIFKSPSVSLSMARGCRDLVQEESTRSRAAGVRVGLKRAW